MGTSLHFMFQTDSRSMFASLDPDLSTSIVTPPGVGNMNFTAPYALPNQFQQWEVATDFVPVGTNFSGTYQVPLIKSEQSTSVTVWANFELNVISEYTQSYTAADLAVLLTFYSESTFTYPQVSFYIPGSRIFVLAELVFNDGVSYIPFPPSVNGSLNATLKDASLCITTDLSTPSTCAVSSGNPPTQKLFNFIRNGDQSG